MKFGLDFGGVITERSAFFSELSQMLVSNGHDVHIITGNKRTPALLAKLETLGIKYTHIFSIADHHWTAGTPMSGYEANNTWIADDVWDRTKALYCAEHLIDLHLDDSKTYGQHFTTPYATFQS